MLVLTLGDGVCGFTLDTARGEFVLTHRRMTVPEANSELAVDTALAASWEPPVRRYLHECMQGTAGPRGQPFSLRWEASLVAEVHRVLTRGGIYMCPTAGAGKGGLSLPCSANPVAMLVEQGGGAASTGRERILDVPVDTFDRRVSAFLGARDEVQRVEQYDREHRAGLEPEFRSPLFNERSLFPSR
jgi:fructose-1,6-bisphosphatase